MVRPSQLYKLDEEDEVTCWSFDRAVQTFGNALESKLQKVARDSKKQAEADRKVTRELDKWLSSADPKDQNVKGRYRDPMALMNKKK